MKKYQILNTRYQIQKPRLRSLLFGVGVVAFLALTTYNNQPLGILAQQAAQQLDEVTNPAADQPKVILTRNETETIIDNRDLYPEGNEPKLTVLEHNPQTAPEEFYIDVAEIATEEVKQEKEDTKGIVEKVQKAIGFDPWAEDKENKEKEIKADFKDQVVELKTQVVDTEETSAFLPYYFKENEDGTYEITIKSAAGSQRYTLNTNKIGVKLAEKKENEENFQEKVYSRPIFQFQDETKTTLDVAGTPSDGETKSDLKATSDGETTSDGTAPSDGVEAWQDYSLIPPISLITLEQTAEYILIAQKFTLAAENATTTQINAELELKLGFDPSVNSGQVGNYFNKLTFRLADNENLNRVIWENEVVNSKQLTVNNDESEQETQVTHGNLTIDWSDFEAQEETESSFPSSPQLPPSPLYQSQSSDTQTSVTFYPQGKQGALEIDPTLSTTVAATTVNISVSGEFEIEMDAAKGGVIDSWYDLENDSGKADQLAHATHGLFNFMANDASSDRNIYSETAATQQVLEVTDTRAVVQYTGQLGNVANYDYTLTYTIHAAGEIYIKLELTNNTVSSITWNPQRAEINVDSITNHTRDGDGVASDGDAMVVGTNNWVKWVGDGTTEKDTAVLYHYSGFNYIEYYEDGTDTDTVAFERDTNEAQAATAKTTRVFKLQLRPDTDDLGTTETEPDKYSNEYLNPDALDFAAGSKWGGSATAVTRAAVNTSTGNQDITTAKLGGQTPKAAWFILSRVTADGTATDHAGISLGAVTATGERWTTSNAAQHGVGTTNTHREDVSTSLVLLEDPTNSFATEAEADFVGFIPNGVRINWTTAPGSAYLLTVILFAGTGVNAYAGEFTGTTKDNAVDITAPGFEPDLVLFASNYSETGRSHGDIREAMGVVANITGTPQGYAGFWSDTAQTTSAGEGRVSSTYAIGGASYDIRAQEIGSFDASGFSATSRGGDLSIRYYFYLALAFSDASVWAGPIDSPTSTGDKAWTDPGFKPQFVGILPSFVTAYDTEDATGLANTFGLGTITSNGSYSNTISDEDGLVLGTTNTQSLSANTALNVPFDDGSAGFVASYSSMDANGWTLNFSTTDSTTRKWYAFAIEEPTLLDGFNEAQGAYTIDAASSTTKYQASRADFDIDGGTYTRYKPAFKIRKWRSTDLPTAVSLEGTTLYPGTSADSDLNYNASLKPFSEAWYEDGGSSTQIADGGDTGAAAEYLNEAGNDYTLTGLTTTDTIYLGSDDQFTGVNYILSTQGVDASAAIDWEYYNGSAWTDLSGDSSETSGSDVLTTTNGSFYFTEPTDWATFKLTATELGGSDVSERTLYWIRGTPGVGYDTVPIIDRMWTDILVFQYLDNITSNSQTFVITSEPVRVSSGSIQIDVPNRYRAIMETGDTSDYILIKDRAQNDSSPNSTHEFQGPYIYEGAVAYQLSWDADRKTTILESSSLRARIRVEGCFDTTGGGACLTDGTDNILVTVDYTFTTEGVFVTNITDFRSTGIALDSDSGHNGYEWLSVWADVTDAAFDDTANIIYGDGETEATTSTDGQEFEDTNKYVVLPGTGTYQDAFIGIQRAGWFDESGAGSVDEWQWDEANTGTQDLIAAQEQNVTTIGLHYAKWFFLMLAQAALDTEAEREAYINDFRNPDILSNYVTGSEWNDPSTGSGQGAANANAPAAASPGLEFDGTDDYVDIGTGPTSVKSVEFWVYLETTTEYFVNLTSTTDYIWANAGTVTATGFTSPTIYVNGAVSSTLVADQWQHVAVTDSTAENASNLDISRTADASYLEGKIDEVRVWSDVRTPAEIQQNMFKQISASSGNLVGYWRLNENTGTTAHDEHANSNDGTIYDGVSTGATWRTGFVPDHYNEAEGVYTVDASGSQVELDIDGGSNVSNTLAGAESAGDTSIVLTSSDDFPTSGTAYIDGDRFTFTSNTVATETLGGIPATGEDAIIAHAASSVVAVANRHKPMVKIRQYRLNDKPSSVTMEGTGLSEGTDYNVDYKPISDAYFADELTMYYPLEDTTADVGGNLTNSGCSFVAGKYGKGVECNADAEDVNVSITEGTDYEKEKGTIEFWYQPDYNHDDGANHFLFNLRYGSSDQVRLLKENDNDIAFNYTQSGTSVVYQIDYLDYSWTANDWVHIRVEWDDSEATSTQQRVYINGVEPTHTDSATDLDSSLLTSPTTLYIGNKDGANAAEANGIIDEFRVYNSDDALSTLAQGGDTADSSEYLFSEANDYTLDFEKVDAQNRGEYLHLGADSMFSGVNIDLDTVGAPATASDFKTKAGNFALNTATGNQSITGVGFQPKVVLFMPTDATADGVSVDAYASFGVGISSSDRRAITSNDEDAQGTTDSSNEWSDTLSIIHDLPGSALADYEADFVSQDADGFTINITNAPGSAKRVGYLALGGSDLTNVVSGGFQANNALGNQTVTGVGFQPDAVIFFSMSSGAPPNSAGEVRYGLGFAVSSTQEGALYISSDVNVATSDTARQQRTDACILVLDDLGVVSAEADFVSMDADGFTVNWTNKTGEYLFYLALKGGQYAVGNLTTQTGTGNFSTTGVGFQPSAGIFASFLNAASGLEVDNLKLSQGFATSSSDRFAAGAVSEDAQATSDADSFQDDGLMYKNYDFAQAVEGAIDFVSWDSDGFTLNQTDADPTGNEMLYLVMGSEDGPNLDWEYWDGDDWASLESISGFTDGTSNLTQDGAVYWGANPTNWRPYSVNGSTDLYYIRTSINKTAGSYTTDPIENFIKTDILLLQYLANVSSADQTILIPGFLLRQLMRHGAWFNDAGILQPFTF